MLDWIMTIPGMLISCGVVLLILAIVLFIIGNKKGKAAKVAPVTTDAPAPEAITTDTISTVSEPVAEPAPVEEVAPAVSEATPVNGVINFTPEVETPVETSEPVVATEPAVEVAPVEESAPAVELPTVEPVAEAQPAVEEPAVTIYGGNSPLENTQAETPVVEPTPYGGAPEINVVETPAVEQEATPVMEMPVVEPVVETPTAPAVEIPEVAPTPVAPAEPVVEPTPVVPQQPAIEIPEPTTVPDNTNM